MKELSIILTALISPLGLALLLLLLALVLGLRRSRVATWMVLLAASWLGLWSLPVPANWISLQVSEGSAPLDAVALRALPKAPAIVLLGGGVSPATAQRPVPDLGESSDRIWQAARLYHAGRATLIVASGGADARISLTSEAQAMKVLLLDLGVPASAIVLEEISRNTRENATETARLLKAHNIDKVLLVTSASHMRRSRTHFEAAGLAVIPVPADHDTLDYAGLRRWLPSSEALDLSARSLKEWVGQRVW
ncbi:MAG: hypothetical protein RI906_2070 [Pseudomonadota bacterium]|jgi:uncharacterized SAM-binding protein YcdF (DUF218 family)